MIGVGRVRAITKGGLIGLLFVAVLETGHWRKSDAGGKTLWSKGAPKRHNIFRRSQTCLTQSRSARLTAFPRGLEAEEILAEKFAKYLKKVSEVADDWIVPPDRIFALWFVKMNKDDAADQ